MLKYILSLLSLFALNYGYAQPAPVFRVEIGNDSILMGNNFTVTYIMENGQAGEFFAPDFTGFQLASGPNTSMQTTIINGTINQSTRYTYILAAHTMGDFFLAPASVEINGEYLETLPVPISVYPNPDGIVQPLSPNQPERTPFGNDFFGSDAFPGEDFFNSDLWGEDMFERFFQQSPFGEGFTPLDSLPETTTKKRKTTRI